MEWKWVLDQIIDSLKIEDHEIRKVIIGLYTTYIANNKQAGLSSTLYIDAISGGGHKHFTIRGAGDLEKKRGGDLCQYIYSDVGVEASIGMAAINSYINIDFKRCRELNALKIIMKEGEGRNIAVIGNFPFVKKLKSVAKNLFVFELSPMGGDYLLPHQMPEYLPRADVVAITGTAFLNRTFHGIVKHIRKGAYRLILGPSTPMSAVLFDYGIDALCGSYVEDSIAVESCVHQAVPFKFIRGVKHLTMTR
jgi:uncharacterized protein (DUF4213/DUF364 family)